MMLNLVFGLPTFAEVPICIRMSSLLKVLSPLPRAIQEIGGIQNSFNGLIVTTIKSDSKLHPSVPLTFFKVADSLHL